MQKAFLVVVLLLAIGPADVQAQTAVSKVVTLITELKAKIQADGMKEQQSYDKYACWCEKTLARKANDISNEKDTIDEMQTLVTKLKCNLGTHNAEIAQLKKDIASNKQAQKDATTLRKKENAEYDAERTQSEQCIGALEAAVKVLTGAGEGKFLQTFRQAQLLSVVAGVRTAVKKASASSMISDDDLAVINHFVQSPQELMGKRSKSVSAAQVSANPFGDYAPQSTQIQGILKGMYDAMTADLEKDNAAEADKQKSFEEIMATKKQEMETLEKTLEKQTADAAAADKTMADSKTILDDSKSQLEADETFFADAKEGCKVKAKQWAVRTRLRTEELQGINKAIQILDSPEARKTFTKSTTTFLQLKSVRKTVKKSKMSSARTNAYSKLKAVATKYQNVALAEAAASVKTGGHFDEAIASVVEQVKLLREEEQADIDHRDRCQSAETKNKQDMADLDHEIEKTKEALGAMDDTSKELQKRIETLESQMKETKTEMKEILDSRNEEVDAFRKAMQEDMDAVDLLDKAIVSLSAFYKRNKLPLSLAQKANGPKYSVDEDKAPETTFAGADYGGRQSESSGLIGMLSMLKEDTEKEIQTSKEDDAEAEAEYEKERGALQATYDATKATKIETETQLADLKDKIAQYEEYKMQKGNELDAQKQLEKTIFEDCEWVKTEFEDRAKMRKQEMQDLLDSKNMLGGMEGDDDDQ
eukprot:gnl/TRDRNA2_/TRDRNA2_177604_c2_seq69.p1 gnl/TRDRNA2_/TRDRNA2_177604_c2~~gnl/TRDRNA2_/TRDRNA2_177604_c2_seq69.p1  ORF type:complete len:705 (+),score=261.27 gnl/TRDRNA2_/TRDRNA2_177604_c2_seq69:55-2169(+)